MKIVSSSLLCNVCEFHRSRCKISVVRGCAPRYTCTQATSTTRPAPREPSSRALSFFGPWEPPHFLGRGGALAAWLAGWPTGWEKRRGLPRGRACSSAPPRSPLRPTGSRARVTEASRPRRGTAVPRRRAAGVERGRARCCCRCRRRRRCCCAQCVKPGGWQRRGCSGPARLRATPPKACLDWEAV